MNSIDGDTTLKGTLNVRGEIVGFINRDNLITDDQAVYSLLPQNWRVWDAFQTALGSAGSDDLGVTAGVFGTGCPYIHSGDLNALGAITRYARAVFTLPVEYVSNSTVYLNFSAGMLTAVASVSATVDVEAYKVNRDTLKTGADLVTTAASSCNSLVFADKPFAITGVGLNPGDALDLRIAIIANSATASSHFVALAAVEMLLNVKG